MIIIKFVCFGEILKYNEKWWLAEIVSQNNNRSIFIKESPRKIDKEN